MRSNTVGKLSLALNIILILFLIVYFLVPFSATGVWAKVFSPLCQITKVFQGDEFVPGWCGLRSGTPGNQNQTVNANNNDNNNNNLNTNLNANSNINNNTNVNAGIANPAAVKCQTDGGTLQFYTAAGGGQNEICIFSDKSICEEWAYFRGECKVGQCQLVCQKTGTASEGMYNSCTNELIQLQKCAPVINANANLNANTNINANIANPKPTVSSTITVTSPTANEQLTSPLIVSGRAKTPDNKIYVRVKNQAGSIAISVNGTMKNVGADGYGDFKLTINYEFSTTKEGSIDVYGVDGTTEVGLVNIPVKF